MTRMTSRERRGSILVVGIGCLLILATALLRCSRRCNEVAPAATDSICIAPADTVNVSPANPDDSSATARRRVAPKKATQKKPAPAGRQRDYLSEPVGER